MRRGVNEEIADIAWAKADVIKKLSKENDVLKKRLLHANEKIAWLELHGIFLEAM